MPLTYDLTKVRDYESLFNEYDDNEVLIAPRKDRLGMFLDAIIWSTIAIGLGEITEGNVDEWVFRLEFRRLCGVSTMADKIQITKPIISRFIGLKTNVICESRRKFLMRVSTRVESDVNGSRVMVPCKKHNTFVKY